MKKIIFLFILISVISITTRSQSCLPEGIEFNTQQEIEAFQVNFPECKKIEGDVTISGQDIKNLNGLNELTEIEGYLAIGYQNNGNPILESLNGFANLKSVKGGLMIYENHQLINLSGLTNLVSLDFGLFIYYNANLVSLTGLDSIKSIKGMITIDYNNSLTSLGDLAKIDSGNIDQVLIENNASLSSCAINFICDLLSDSTSSIGISNNSDGCKNSEEVLISCESLGLPLDNRKENFTIYPNPASRELFITNCNFEKINEINIYNQNGKIVLKQKYLNQRVDLSLISPGLYIIELATKTTIHRKILIIE